MVKKMGEMPEAELVQNTFIVREMRAPPSIELTKRGLLRWFALATGLISERESRASVFDVLDALFYFQFGKKVKPTSNDLKEHLKEKVSEKLLRYHLKKLVDAGLIERKKLKYSFAVDPKAEADNIRAGFRHNVAGKVEDALKEAEIVLGKLAEMYNK